MRRRLCSAILTLQAIMVGLSTLVLVNVTDMNRDLGLGLGLGLCVACVVVAGLLRHRWAYTLGWIIQFAVIAMAIETLALGVLGLIFLALWVTAVRLGAKIEHDREQWVDQRVSEDKV